jgi:hypothetical protein
MWKGKKIRSRDLSTGATAGRARGQHSISICACSSVSKFYNSNQGECLMRRCTKCFIRRLPIAILILPMAMIGCSRGQEQHPPRIHVEVSQGLPASVTSAVLSLKLSMTNGTVSSASSPSLDCPISAGGGWYGHHHDYQEERLLSIRADGFLMFLKIRDDSLTQTNIVLFRYGETTETNMLGWRIVGRFK